jgi:ankyrin repeat protein
VPGQNPPPVRSLREHPDLNQLRRQAKELLDAYRAGDANAVAEVTHHYHGADPATFALHDAQLVLARAYAFESWPKLKAFVDGATVKSLMAAVRAGDRARVETILKGRPEIVNMDASDNDEHRALHHAVLARDAEMVRLLMAHGADARIGIYPHRVPTTPMAIATERGYDDIVAIIQEAETKQHISYRYTGGAPLPHPPPELMGAIQRGDAAAAIAFLESSPLLREHPGLLIGGGPHGITLLHISAARLVPELAAWLLARGAEPNRRGGPGYTPMDMLGRWPINGPHDRLDEMSDLLLKHGAERTAYWAVAMNDGGWLRARHSEGALTNPISDVGGLVTHAVRLHRPEMLTLLLDLGFDPDERSDTDTPGSEKGRPAPLGSGVMGKPLEFCAKHQRADLADILVRRGAAVTASAAVALGMGDWLRARHAAGTLAHPAEGDGLLTVAAEHGRIDMLRLLLELGFDVEERRRVVGRDEVTEARGNPLARAADKGNLAMAQLLIEHGGDPNGAIPGPYRRRDQAMLDLLMRHGGVVSAGTAAYHRDVAIARERIQQEDAGRLPPGAVGPGHTVAEDLLSGDSGDPEIMRMALARIDWPADDPRWYGTLKGPLSFWNYVPWIESPLWQVDRRGYLECFKLVLARTHANVKGSFGRSILHDVMAMGHHDGASGWITEEEALAFAVALLDAGARTDVRDDLLKSTPLGWACRWGRLPIVRELLRRGVDPLEPDAEPWATPRAWAGKMGHREILALLDNAT